MLDLYEHNKTVYRSAMKMMESTGKPLIFDVVNNFDNLYSASWLQEEIQTISAVYQERGNGEQIVEESFQVIDKVREYRTLLAQLEERLSATWDINYQAEKRITVKTAILIFLLAIEYQMAFSLTDGYTGRRPGRTFR